MTEPSTPSITAVATAGNDCGPVGAPRSPRSGENVILTSLMIYMAARLSSLWPLLYGTACCFIEFAALLGSL